MAAQVLTGRGIGQGFTYTNSTEQNVRIVINFMKISPGSSMSWTGDNGTATVRSRGFMTIGKYLGYAVKGKEQTDGTGGGKVYTTNYGNRAEPSGLSPILSDRDLGGIPTEIALGPGYTFYVGCSDYNITIIPEAG